MFRLVVGGHAGGTLPYLIGRLDQCYENIPACRTKTREKPSLHARRIYADSVVFTDDVLAMALRVFGTGNVLYGSDYPHTIGDPIGCLARVDRLPDGARSRVRWSVRCASVILANFCAASALGFASG